MRSPVALVLHVLVHAFLPNFCWALGSMSSIAASYGDNTIVCAIEATHEQGILCWGGSSSSNSSTGEQLQISIPPLMGLSGGSGFLCGLRSQDQHAFCFSTNFTNASSSVASNIVPQQFANTRYVSIAAGESHTCALRESSENVSLVDCWGGGTDLRAPDLPGDVVSVVSGRSFACALRRTGECICWDDEDTSSSAAVLANMPAAAVFDSVSAGGDHVCGIDRISGEAICWGSADSGKLRAPKGIAFATLAAGLDHTCGIRRDTHAMECWGNIHFTAVAAFPERTAFLAVASGSGVSCGIREWNLLAECRNISSPDSNSIFAPPLELLSPGLCSKATSCASGHFNFNATNHGVPMEGTGSQLCDYGSRICAPCATACPAGSFMASQCMLDEDVICVECGLCATAECEEWCRNANILSQEISRSKTSIVIVISVSAGFLFVVTVVIIHRRIVELRKKKPKDSSSSVHNLSLDQASASAAAAASAKHHDFSSDYQVQAFRFSELRDATNGFKELNEIGRGSYGIVYKATLLPEGTHLAVKRASAARRIECSSKDFEAELGVLTKTRHANLVNLVGYCDQMGERLLIYEFMHNGNLHDHLHEEHEHTSCPIAHSWINRLSIASQAARALEFLHSNKVVHGNVKCANVMIDREWRARVADFAIISNLHHGSKEGDVYEFGVVLLELVTGKKTGPLHPPVNLVDWALPLVKLQQFAEMLDPQCAGHNASMTQVANLAVLCLAVCKSQPSMAEVARLLEEQLESCQQHHHNHHYHHETTTTTCINFRDKLHF